MEEKNLELVPLNLKIERELKEFFKNYAKQHRDSMTRLITEFIKSLR